MTPLRLGVFAGCLLLLPTGGGASERCAACHPDEVAAYLRTGMGRSIGRPSALQPSGAYRHGLSETSYAITADSSGMTQRIARGELSAEYAVDYVIGSGNAAFGYLVSAGNAVFQSPIAYYAKRKRWGAAPGMERYAAPDFTRPVTPECLWCHAGRPLPLPQTVNRYEQPVFAVAAISCERCHGDARAHLGEPAAANIVNPAKLPPVERDSVCEQCHLSGVVRILNPGKSFDSYRPGEKLESAFSVFTAAQPDAGRPFQVVSHVEQLALSRCAQSSKGQLWCGTCHNPHAEPQAPSAYFRERCLDCHGPALAADHGAPARDCIGCHMPKRQSWDSGHSAFTDHRIAAHPARTATPAEDPPAAIRAWRAAPEPPASRNLGLANVMVGRQRNSPRHAANGLDLLRSVEDEFADDADFLEGLGTAFVLTGEPRKGADYLQKAVEAQPGHALRRLSLAAAWWELGAAREATAALEAAIRLDPYLESAYRMLARVYADTGRPEKVRETWRRYLEHRPRSIEARRQAALAPGAPDR